MGGSAEPTSLSPSATDNIENMQPQASIVPHREVHFASLIEGESNGEFLLHHSGEIPINEEVLLNDIEHRFFDAGSSEDQDI